MTALEKSILDSLLDLERTVKAMPTSTPKPDLQPLFHRLDDLTRQLPKGTDANLLHYLNRKSYEKARLLLEGCDAENAVGNCRHV